MILELIGYHFNVNDLKEMITDKTKMTKIKPVLISFSGLPESGKTKAVKHILKCYVDETPFTPVTGKDKRLEAVGISYYELVAAGSNVLRNLCITEVTKESSVVSGILSAYRHNLLEGKAPVFDLDATRSTKGFQNYDLENHLQFIYKHLCLESSIPQHARDEIKLSSKDIENAEKLKKLLPEGIALINIWDVAINETVRHFLAALQGHLYNLHMWLFLDLERDIDSLGKPPAMTITSQEKRRRDADGVIFMKWRPRLHYLLRSCRISESKDKQRRRVCTIFAKHSGMFNGELQEKIELLESKVQSTAKHIGVMGLLEEKIKTIKLDVTDEKHVMDDSSLRLYQKFQNVICETPFQDVPLAWVFLRSLFYCLNRKVITKTELKTMADECKMAGSLEEFCKFYTSFGSILDISLIDPKYQYVIVKPIGFLRSLDSFLCPTKDMHQQYPTLGLGIIPEEAFQENFGGDWPAFINALISLNLATRVAASYIEMPKVHSYDRHSTFYFVPLSRTGPLIMEPDCNSVHVITSISTPHVFKQVSITKHLLALLPHPTLVPCENMNQTIIKDGSISTTITLVSHSPVMRISLDESSESACSCIVKAYKEIAKSSAFPVEYKFVVLCVKDTNTSLQSICSSHYHILPDDELCLDCKKAKKTESKLLKNWNIALRREKFTFQPSKG